MFAFIQGIVERKIRQIYSSFWKIFSVRSKSKQDIYKAILASLRSFRKTLSETRLNIFDTEFTKKLQKKKNWTIKQSLKWTMYVLYHIISACLHFLSVGWPESCYLDRCFSVYDHGGRAHYSCDCRQHWSWWLCQCLGNQRQVWST